MGIHRSLSPSDDELDALGQELIAWCLEVPKKGEEKHALLPQWYSVKKHILRDTWKAIIKQPVFRPYYEEAQVLLGMKLIQGSVKEGFAHRFLRLYHADVREDDDAIAAAKNKANSQVLSGEEIIKAIREDMNARTKEQSVRGIPPAPEPDLAAK